MTTKMYKIMLAGLLIGLLTVGGQAAMNTDNDAGKTAPPIEDASADTDTAAATGVQLEETDELLKDLEKEDENIKAASEEIKNTEANNTASRNTASRAGTRADEPVTSAPQTTSQQRSVSYKTHTVQRGDTFWGIAVKYGIPMPELLKLNKMTERTPLNVGMTLTIPVYHIPVKEKPGPQYGELLDWWTDAQYVWPIGRDARVIDFATGKSFRVRRTIGAFHADVEPLTAEDARIMREIWGGWSWATRPVIVEVDGRRLAASANGQPHSIQTIINNGFNGHFCIHFLNSTRHKDNRQQADHQRNIRKAAGQ